MNNTKESWVKKYAKRYFIDALGAMAKGLFATLLTGTILSAVVTLVGLAAGEEPGGFVGALLAFLKAIVSAAQNGYVVGGAIGIAIAHGMKVSPLAIFSAAVTGALGYTSGAGGAGPVGAYIAAIVGAELGNLVSGKTKVDILVVPLVSIISGGLVGYLLGAPLGEFMRWLGGVIGKATYMSPVPMGIIISVVIGLILTAPISSAAICSMIFVINTETMEVSTQYGLMLAAGAATVGCCCQMVGFAAASFRENRFGGLVSQGLGTSMLQVPNIVRHPAILVPPTLAAAILGPISTTLLPMFNQGINAGMGTCGLVGQIGTYITMLGMDTPDQWWWITIKVLLLHFILPAAISFAASEFMRKMGWIKRNDMLLE